MSAGRWRGANNAEPPPVRNDGPAVWDLVIADMNERNRVGTEKYGTPLQAHNGRDALVDAYQEALDLAVYLRQAIEERGAAPAGGTRRRSLDVFVMEKILDALGIVWRPGAPGARMIVRLAIDCEPVRPAQITVTEVISEEGAQALKEVVSHYELRTRRTAIEMEEDAL